MKHTTLKIVALLTAVYLLHGCAGAPGNAPIDDRTGTREKSKATQSKSPTATAESISWRSPAGPRPRP